MPTYEYRCADCQETFTRMETMSEHTDSPPKCPSCEGENVRQLLSAFFAKTSKKS